MKTQTVYAANRRAAAYAMPWAAKIVKVDGGYMGFESLADWQVWRNQR